ncbi:hypothetical protein YC2023_118110 [Brassica napus]
MVKFASAIYMMTTASSAGKARTEISEIDRCLKTTAIPVYEEIERLGSWLWRRDRTFIKLYNGDSLGENLVVAVDDDGLFTERITHFSVGGFLLSNNISCYLRPKAGLLNRGALFTHIHFAGDQTLLSYIEPFPVGMLLA